MSIVDTPASTVERVFGDRLGHPVRLLARRLAGEGLSDETAVLTFHCQDGTELRLVVRLFRAGAVARHEVHPHRLHQLLTVLDRTSLPVPTPQWFDPSPELFGAPYSVVSWIPGTAVVPWSPEGRQFLADAGSGPIGELFCQVLADIHAVDTRSVDLGFLGMPGPGKGFASARVDRLASYLDEVRAGIRSPEPILADGLGWLRAHVPAAGRVGLVHGDYRTGNMLFDGSRISAVIDWEFAALGDPLYDVGWVCCPSNRIGTDLVCMLLPEHSFLERYEYYSGLPVDRDALRFWVLYHQVRHAVMWLEAGHAFQRGATDDLRLARMHYTMPTMRRMVADLLECA